MIENKFEILDKENILKYALNHYTNPHCTGMEEFIDDYKTLKYLKRLFNRYSEGNGLKERLIFNHLILFYNVFDNEAATRILFYKTDEKHYAVLKAFLEYINKLPNIVCGIPEDLLIKDIPIDIYIMKQLEVI